MGITVFCLYPMPNCLNPPFSLYISDGLKKWIAAKIIRKNKIDTDSRFVLNIFLSTNMRFILYYIFFLKIFHYISLIMQHTSQSHSTHFPSVSGYTGGFANISGLWFVHGFSSSASMAGHSIGFSFPFTKIF